MVRDHIGAERDAVTIAIQDDGSAIAFLDHVPTAHGAVGVFDHDAVAQMVINVVPIHAEVKRVDAAQGIQILFEVVRIHHDVVAAIDLDSRSFVVSDDAVCDARVFVAVHEMNSMSAVMINGDALKVNLLNAFRVDSVPAFLRAADAHIRHLHPPELRFRIFAEVARRKDQRWLARLVGIDNVGCRTRSDDAGLRSLHL